MENKEKKVIIWDHTVAYGETASHGVYYLSRQIDEREARVFFDEAFNRGFAFFEDQMGYNYKLIHHGAEYQLVKV